MGWEPSPPLLAGPRPMEGVYRGMAECPLNGCDYEGSTASVEAHISGKRDEIHKGRQGSNYRGRIKETVTEDDVAVPGEDDGGDDPDAQGGGGVSVVESEGRGGSLASLAVGGLAATVAALAASGDSPSPEEEGSGPSEGGQGGATQQAATSRDGGVA